MQIKTIPVRADALRRLLDAAPIPLPLDNDGANPGDLWAGDGRYIGTTDDPLIAAVIVATVNALPELCAVVDAARAMYEALDDSRPPFRERPRPLDEHNARFRLGCALGALEKKKRP